jgi:uncharacterized protein (DUF1697 family)
MYISVPGRTDIVVCAGVTGSTDSAGLDNTTIFVESIVVTSPCNASRIVAILSSRLLYRFATRPAVFVGSP